MTLPRRLELSAKVAYKTGEYRTGRTAGEFISSSTYLWVLRTRYQLLKSWNILLEGRQLTVSEAQDSMTGFLGAIEYDINDKFQIGIGYNFSSFNDDITNLDFESRWLVYQPDR